MMHSAWRPGGRRWWKVGMRERAARIVDSTVFRGGIIALIVLNGVAIGAATSEAVVHHAGEWLRRLDDIILWIFIAEVVLKLSAVWPNPGRYFRDPWNSFDFTVVALSLIPATGQFATVARLLRLLRVMRLISAIPELRLIVATLLRSLPSMGHVVLLMSIVFYIYGVAGFHLFHTHDPEHWGTLGLSLLTLFRVVTLEDWTDVMYTAMGPPPPRLDLLRQLRGGGHFRHHQSVHCGGAQQPGSVQAPATGDPTGIAGGAPFGAAGAQGSRAADGEAPASPVTGEAWRRREAPPRPRGAPSCGSPPPPAPGPQP